MCAIVGFNNINKNNILNDMLDMVNHRGPDDRGIYEDDFISLGHNRLSILDLSNHGHQPMIFDDLVIVYNGEVYNFQDIKQELVLLGYEFFSDTDTEVVLKAYHRWGIKAIDKFIGMFAFVIYNKTKQELTLVRDRVGVKPLYYFIDDDKFVFASELKPIMLYSNNLSINNHSLQGFFQLGYIPNNLTIFNNCFKLPAGNYGVFDLKNHKLRIEQYWSILPYFNKPKFQKTEIELINELEEILISACMYRTVSDVPIGVFLSGGIDSSTVAAILQKHYGNIKTFTVGFNEKSYDESEYAKKVANHIGSIHTEKILDSKKTGEIFENYTEIYDEPFGNYGGIPAIFVSMLAKENNIKVVLDGVGGDEIFCGYNHYHNNYLMGKQIFRLPFLVRKLLSLASVKFLKNLFKYNDSANRYKQLDNMLKSIITAKDWLDLHIKSLYSYNTKRLKKLFVNVDDNNRIHNIIKIPKQLHPVEQMMLHDYHIPMIDHILVNTDRATMSVSIEGREPLLDHRIAEFMAQVPIELKYKDGDKKYLIKKVLARYLPESMIERPKMGFGIPMLEWFGRDLRHIFAKYLQQPNLKQHNLLNTKYIRKQHKKLLKNKEINVKRLWLVLVFQMWYAKYKKYILEPNTNTQRRQVNSNQIISKVFGIKKYTKYLYYSKKFRHFFSKEKDSLIFNMSKNERMSLEISVKVGCGLMCTYCPQDNYIKSFKTNYPDEFKVLTKEMFLDCMKNVSTNVLIKWTGFTEPLYSKDFQFFCEYLHDHGYQQSISTTLKGTKNSVDWFINHAHMFERILLHLPDNEGLMKCKVDKDYISNFESILSNPDTPLDRIDFFLIGESFENNIEKMISKYVKEGVVDKKRVISAQVLNTRNSTVTLDSSGLDNIKFRSKAKETKGEEFYCAYRRLNQGVLLPNGEVSLCCQDYKLEYILGNLKKQNLDNLYQKIQDSKLEREHFISGSFFPCTSCEHYRPLSSEFTGHLLPPVS